MKKHIVLQNKKVSYTLRKSRRARRMRLAVYCGGDIVVTIPFHIQENIAEKFIRDKSGWILSKVSFFKQFKGKEITRFNHLDYLKHKNRAHQLIEQKVKQFNALFRFKINNINIKNQKTRWGSCSRRGNLNFNYKILFLSEPLADYIIVHELCHLAEFNHSQRFWNLVAKVTPDYLTIRKQLRVKGLNYY